MPCYCLWESCLYKGIWVLSYLLQTKFSLGMNERNYYWHQWGYTWHSAWLKWMLGFAFPLYASTAQWHTSVLRILASINLIFVFLVPKVSRINGCTLITKVRDSLYSCKDRKNIYLLGVLQIEQAVLWSMNILRYLRVS